MKKNTVLAAAMILGLFVASCKKDVFNQKKLTGTWEIQEYKVGNTDLFVDSLSATFQGGGPTVKTKFNSASIVFEEEGDFTEYINYGFSVGYSGYSYSYPGLKDTTNGLWSNVDSDLLLSFNVKTNYGYGSYGSNSYNYLSINSTPMNGPLVTGQIYEFNSTERYDIKKVTKSELEMEGLNSIGQKIYIKAIKK